MPGNSRRHLKRQVKVSDDVKGRDGLGRTWNPVQGSSDGLDVLPTTSVIGGFELLDKVGSGWTRAVDDIHERPGGEGIK